MFFKMFVLNCHYIEQFMSGQTNGLIRIGNFKIDRNQVLGKGATGFVYRGLNAETNIPVAVKAIQMKQINNEVTKYLLDGEKKASRTIKSPYVVSTYDIVQDNDFCYIMMEECTGGTLKDYIHKKGKINSDEAIEIFRKIVVGYISIIEALFIHRDLKSANIMMKGNGDPVIIDFGYCEMIMGKRPMIQYNVGSPSYMSPESYSKSRYSEKSDIWALGVILYEMLEGKTLDAGLNIKEYFHQIEKRGAVPNSFEGMPDLAKELLKLALAVKPQERGTIHKLKYLIDKNLIPQMQLKMNKVQSENPNSQLKPRINTMNVNIEPNEWKPKSSIKESTKTIGERENKLDSNRTVLQSSPILQSPKSLLKIQTTNAINSNSKIIIKNGEIHPHHFQTINKKNVGISGLKGITSYTHISEEFRNQPSLRKIVSLPLSRRDLPGSMRII